MSSGFLVLVFMVLVFAAFVVVVLCDWDHEAGKSTKMRLIEDEAKLTIKKLNIELDHLRALQGIEVDKNRTLCLLIESLLAAGAKK